MRSADLKELAAACGFELAGVCLALPLPDFAHYAAWIVAGMAGRMSYLVDRRGDVRSDPRNLLPPARSILCVGKLYNGPEPSSPSLDPAELGWISRYAWGEDYHRIVREGLEDVVRRIPCEFEYKVCVDTAPLLERSYARMAGLGWIGKNTCLINQERGSWFFLGELLLSLDLEPDAPPPDRCGSCTRCIDACPTHAIVPLGQAVAGHGPAAQWAVDSRLCISYFTIELRGPAPEEARPAIGRHVFGCDICQDVCPWNRDAPVTADSRLHARHFAPPLDKLAALSEQEFREIFRDTPVPRAKYSGFLRNVAIAMGNSGAGKFRAPLERLAAQPDAVVTEAARWALARLAC